MESVKLHIGANAPDINGYTTLNIKSGVDVRTLPYKDGSVDEVYASRILERFSYRETPTVLGELVRVLKPGGLLRVSVFDFDKIAQGYIEGRKEPFGLYLYGEQADQYDFYHTCFNRQTLISQLRAAGLVDVRDWRSEFDDASKHWAALNLVARKPGGTTKENKAAPKIVAVLSSPRLGFTDSWCAIAHAMTVCRIPLIRVSGAYWGQCLTRGIEQAIDGGADYVLTLDYDTVFSPDDINALVSLAESREDVDAVVPVQVRREMNCSLFGIVDENGRPRKVAKQADFSDDLVRIRTGHFGLTLLRARSLANMSRPWFEDVPDEHGGWGDGRVDADINFWFRWAECGNTVFLAPRVVVGHLQLVVSWPNETLAATHQYLNEYTAKGKPEGTWR